MFGASFEYVVEDPRNRITVGEMKQRKAREREGSIMTNSSGDTTSVRPPTPKSKASKTSSTNSGEKRVSPPANTKPKTRFGGLFGRAKVHEKVPSVTEMAIDLAVEPKTNVSLTSLQTTISNSTPSSIHEAPSTAPSSTGPTPAPSSAPTSAPTSQLPPTPTYDPDEIAPIHGSLPARRPPPNIPVPPTPNDTYAMLPGNGRSERSNSNFSESRPVSNVSYRPILSSSPSNDEYMSYPIPRTSRAPSHSHSPLATPVETRSAKLSPFPAVARYTVLEPEADSESQSAAAMEHEAMESALGAFQIDENYDHKQKYRPDTRRPTVITHQRRLSMTKDQPPSWPSPISPLPELPPYETVRVGHGLHSMATKEPVPITLRSTSRLAGEVRQPASAGVNGRTSFQQALFKMENAGMKIMCKRLSEDWSSDEAESSFLEEVAFEQRMWGLVAYQFLTFGRCLQSGAHELLSDARVEDGRRLLHLHGSAADGWVLAAKYPNVTVYSVSTQDISNPACSWPPPLNHHPLYIPFANSPLPFPDNYFDVISSKSLPAVLRNEDWIPLLKECYRVLRPGGWLEVQIIDPSLTKQGEHLKLWLDTKIIRELVEEDYAVRPSDDILSNFAEAGFQDVKRSRIALPASFNPRTAPRGQGPDPDATRMMVLVGRHFYEELYRGFVPVQAGGPIGGDAMWWNNRAIKAECEALNTCFGLVISFGQKEY